ncbi:MAG: twin-arginine translocation signal domain-containing protein, partial [Chloroflexota bacterium]
MYNTDKDKNSSRRSFIKKATAASAAIAGTTIFPAEVQNIGNDDKQPQNRVPWFRRITRWGQTNITEKDPVTYDIGWWRNHWKKTQTQGVIINAGGIVAYYPTKIPYHYQARYLQGRDLFGDLCRAAHEDGLVVFARMDSNRANEEFYKAHPDWFA